MRDERHWIAGRSQSRGMSSNQLCLSARLPSLLALERHRIRHSLELQGKGGVHSTHLFSAIVTHISRVPHLSPPEEIPAWPRVDG